MAFVRFLNSAIGAADVARNYNNMLDDVAWGLVSTEDALQVPPARPTDVSEGMLESDNTVFVFQERGDELAGDLVVDLVPSAGGNYQSLPPPNTGTVIEAGTGLTSYLVHFDPLGQPDVLSHASGAVTFRRPIRGLIFHQGSLESSDPVLGSVGAYTTGPRALDGSSSGSLSFSDDLRTLYLSLEANQDRVVHLRVLTELFGPVAGDMNLDGRADFDDIMPFVEALSDRSRYEAKYGVPPAFNGDLDADGDQDFDDIAPLVHLLGAPLARLQTGVPEPSCLILVVIAVVSCAGWKLRRLAKVCRAAS